jgi:protein TonB
MTLAASPRLDAPLEGPDPTDPATENGAQSLLRIQAPPPNHVARVIAIVAYLALLAAFLTVGFRANESPIDETQVVELAPLPEEAPPEDEPPPSETMELDDLPPPPALQPVAPVEQKPVQPQKPLKVEKPAEKKPTQAHQSSERKPGSTSRTGATSSDAKPGAVMSEAANAFRACLQRAAANIDAPRSGRVSYHALVSASGAVTGFSVSSSGNSALDSIASRLGARCTTVPAPGRPGSLSGGIAFHGP